MKCALVGRQEVQEVPRARVAAPWAGVAAPFLRVEGRGIEGPPPGQRFALRLRRRLPCGGPSIPLPRACSLEPNTARPGLGGAFAGRWE